MALRVFITYSQRDDQILALRLQTLATTRPGLLAYVPPASTRSRMSEPLPSEAEELTNSDLVLAIISGTVPQAMQKELEFARRLEKPIIPIVLKRRAHLTGFQIQPVFYVDPLSPYEAEQEIVEYLNRAQLDKGKAGAALGLIVLALGLLILGKT